MKYTTAGESHGPQLCAIVEDVPAGITISEKEINTDLERRQSGYGRGERMETEHDTVQITSGVRFGKTIGSPITLRIRNHDWENWSTVMSVSGNKPYEMPRETTPRPGHADLVGTLKINSDDCRDILERASARETAARVAAAGIAREFLASLGTEIFSYVTSIGGIRMPESDPMMQAADYSPMDIELSDVRCPDHSTSERMKKAIDEAKKNGDTLGGTFRIVATGLVPGLGEYSNGHKRLSSQLGAALFSIPSVKGVEIGMGFDSAYKSGSKVHDPIELSNTGFIRSSNNAGGLEGGMTTGMPLLIHVAMKPIPTLKKPLRTVNLDTLEASLASTERGDICAVPAGSIVAEGEVAFVLANAYMKLLGNNNMNDIKTNLENYKKRLRMVSR